MKKTILRSEMYFADLDPVIGSEQAGYRPVLVVQNNRGNHHSPTTIVAPITTKKKNPLPTHLVLPNHCRTEDYSIVLLEQLRTIDKARVRKQFGRLNGEILHKLNGRLAVSLGLFEHKRQPLVMTLCRSCAEHYRDTRLYVLQLVNYGLCTKEPCSLCLCPGFDYMVTRKG